MESSELSEELKRGPGRPPKAAFFPVRMLRHYRPLGEYRVIGEDGEMIDPGPVPADQDEGLVSRLYQDGVYGLPLVEAKSLIARGLAERADALPD